MRIEIAPAALLLTQAGATQKLVARGFDADGEPTEVAVTWRSTDPNIVSVGADGTVTAVVALGSAQIVAEAGAVSSRPLLALVAQPVTGAVLVADEQVVGAPVAVSSDDDYGLGWRYSLRLRGVEPAVGAILVASGGAAIAGRVVQVATVGSDRDVTLELVALPDLFEHLSINQSMSLDSADFQPENPSAARSWAPAPVQSPAVAADAEFKLGPFDCKAVSPPQLDLVQPKLEIKPKLTFHVVYNDALEKLSVAGTVDAKLEYRPVFKAVFEGKVTCNAVIGTVVIPVLGAVSWAFAALVPIGLGMELDAKLTLAEVGLKLAASAGATLELGLECPGGGACSSITKFERKPVEPTAELIAPSFTGDQMRLELGVFGYALARFALGSPVSKKLQVALVEGKAGVRQSVDLMMPQAQAEDANYASNFKLASKITLGPGKDLQKGIKQMQDLLGIKLTYNVALLDDLAPLAESPKGTFKITPASVPPNDTTTPATFTVELDPTTYLGIESIEKVEIFWKKDAGNGEFTLDPGPSGCGIISGSGGQSTFTCQAQFLDEHVGVQTFVAFVHAKLLGLPIPIPLEIAIDAKATVTVARQDECGLPPDGATWGTFDESAIQGDSANATIEGPEVGLLSASGRAETTATDGNWSPTVRIRAGAGDYVRIVPLVDIGDLNSSGASPLSAVVHGTAEAHAVVSESGCCGRFGSADAKILVNNSWFWYPYQGSTATVVAEAGASFSGDLGASDHSVLDEVQNIRLFYLNEWQSKSTRIEGHARHRGDGNNAMIEAKVTVEILDVVDDNGNSVPVLICSAAGFNYGVSAGSNLATRVQVSRPTLQASTVAAARR